MIMNTRNLSIREISSTIADTVAIADEPHINGYVPGDLRVWAHGIHEKSRKLFPVYGQLAKIDFRMA